MTPGPISVTIDSTLLDAARMMRDEAIGDVLVVDDEGVRGMVTDRDIVVRGLAEGRDPSSTPVIEVCSEELVTVQEDESVQRAVELMREHALRRLPVCRGDEVVGVVSLGDLAIERDPTSALGDISAAPSNQ